MARGDKGKVTKKVVHPFSRKAAQMTRQAHRGARIDRRQVEKTQKYDAIGEKLNWFKENMDTECKSYTKEEVYLLIEKYLTRFEEELEQIKIVNSLKGRDGKQHIARQEAIRMTLEREQREYTVSGFELPDLINVKHCATFRKWNGEMRFYPLLSMRKITKEKPKEFKPKGVQALKPPKDQDAMQTDT